MARKTLTELINEINQFVQENQTGDITATIMNDLLQSLTNNLYLPSPATISTEGDGLPLGDTDTIDFENFTLAFAGGKLTVTAPAAPVPTVFGSMTITDNRTNDVIIGAGQTTVDDNLFPITPGTDYFPVPGFEAGVVDQGISFNATDSRMVASVGGWYEFTGWLSGRHSTNASTMGVVFGVYRGGTLLAAGGRPTPARFPNGGDIGLISGTGLVNLQANDEIGLLIGTDKTGTLTLQNSTIRGTLLKNE